MKNKLSFYKTTMIKPNQNIDKKQVWEKAKRDLNFNNYCDFVRLLSKQDQFKNVFNFDEIFHNIKDLISPRRSLILCKINNETEAMKEILAALAYLNLCSDKIKKFCELRAAFEKYYLIGDIDNAKITVKKIEKIFGIGFWTVEANFLISNSYDTVTSYKYYENIKEECGDNEYLKIFIRSIRKRVCNTVNVEEISQFIDKKSARLRSLKEDGVVSSEEYFYYRFYNHGGQHSIDLTQIELLISFSEYLSLIDFYNIIDKIVIFVLTDPTYQYNSKNILTKAIKNIDYALSCSPTLGTTFECSILNNSLTFKMNELYYLFGSDYNQCYEKCNEYLHKYPDEFDLILLKSELDVFLNKKTDISLDSLLSKINYVLINLIKKDLHYNQFLEFQDKIYKLSYTLQNTSLFFPYRNFYLDNFYDEGGAINCEFSYICSKYFNVKSNLASIETKSLTSVKAQMIYASDWLRSCNLKNWIIYDEITLRFKKLTNLSLEEIYDTASLVYNDLTETQKIVIKNREAELKFEKLLDSNEISKAISLYVAQQFASKLLVKNFNVKKLNKKLNLNEVEKLYDSLDFCVFADLTNLYGDRLLPFNHQALNSLEYILFVNNVSLPSELTIIKGKEKQFGYLFRHICNERLLNDCIKYSKNLKGKEDIFILNERLKLLKIARELDEKPEIVQINTQIADIENKIRQQQLNKLRKDVNVHYIPKESIRIYNQDFIMKCWEMFNYLRSRSVNLSEEGLIFVKEELIKFKKEYFTILDKQIGINIRHGFFLNKILDFFSSHNCVVLKKDPEDENDINNLDAILNRKKRQLERENRIDLVTKVEDIWSFSKNVYNFIYEELRKIKIISSSNRDGANVFEVYINDDKIEAISRKIFNQLNPYDIQIQLWDEFDIIAEEKFEQIRSTLRKDIYNGISKLYLDALDLYGDNERLWKNDIVDLTETISNWFNFNSNEDEEISLDLYIKSLKGEYSDIEFNQLRERNVTLKSKQINCLNLIIHNLIFNARDHSGLEPSNLKIIFSYDIETSSVILNMRNSMNLIYEDEIQGMICSLETFIDRAKHSDESFDAINKFKGNGYKHIVNELKSSLIDDNWDILFNHKELPRQFEVEIKFNWRV